MRTMKTKVTFQNPNPKKARVSEYNGYHLKQPFQRKGSRLAAGHDLYAINEFVIPAQGQILAETGIAIGLPKETYARIAP